jgi:pyruvate dehydrogenase E2 component (dihydrolipoamide acetyltransferase)
MMYEVKMPQWGMNMTDGVLLKWLKEVGERVRKGDPLAEVEAAKAIGTVEAPVSGMLTELRGAVGDTIAVQDVIAVIDEG